MTLSVPVPLSLAGELITAIMPVPGTMVNLSASYIPAHLTGLIVHPDRALQFDFLINKGDSPLSESEKNEEYTKLVKYFLASLTVPDQDQWVNLSPYEDDRIIKDNFGKTEMGRDLLAQDYLLKQVTSTLMYPESGLGKDFWDKVYARAFEEYGNTDIPVDTFNKVWIIPDQAEVYESGNIAYIVKSHLKVMLDEDYLSLKEHAGITKAPNNTHAIASKVIREIILPEIEKEVNEGKNFAKLRQVFSAMILATWFKRSLKETLLGKVYVDKAKVKGFDVDPQNNQQIYQQYLTALQKGVYNYIKEDFDEFTQEAIPRKYFAGGFQNVLPGVLVATPVSTSVMERAIAQNWLGIDQIGVVLRSLAGAAVVAWAGLGLPADSAAQTTAISAPGTSNSIISGATLGTEDLNDLLRKRADLVQEINNIENQVSPDNLPPRQWQTTLGLQYYNLNDQPNYQIGFGIKGPVGEYGSLSVGVRGGSISGDTSDIYSVLKDGSYVAGDLTYQSDGPWLQYISKLTILKGVLSSRNPNVGQDGYHILSQSKLFDKRVNEVAGAALSLAASRAFRLSQNLVISPYAGAHLWALSSGGIWGAAANAGAYMGMSLDYEIAPGYNIKVYGDKEAAISHENYSSNLDSFGLIPNGRGYGLAYSGGNFSAEVRRYIRLIYNVTQANVVYDWGNNGRFAVSLTRSEGRESYLASETTGSIGYSTSPFLDGRMIFSLNLFASRYQGNAFVHNFNTKGVMATLSFRERINNAEIVLDKGWGYRWDGRGDHHYVHAAGELASRWGNKNLEMQYLLDNPGYVQLVLRNPNMFSTQTYRFADAAQSLLAGLNGARTFDDFVRSVAVGMNGLNPAQQEDRLVLMASLMSRALGRYNVGQVFNAIEDPNKIMENFRSAVGTRGRNPIIGTGGGAQFVSQFINGVSGQAGIKTTAFPTGLLQRDSRGGFSNVGNVVAFTGQGITYLDSGGAVFPTGTFDLMESRGRYGAMTGVIQLYAEVTNRAGRHKGYVLTGDGETIVGTLFSDHADNGAAARDYLRNAGLIRALLAQRRDELAKLDALLKALGDGVKLQRQLSPNEISSPASSPGTDPVGGIDMNSANLELFIKKDQNGAALPVDQQDLVLFSQIEGLVPQIIGISPLNRPPFFSQ